MQKTHGADFCPSYGGTQANLHTTVHTGIQHTYQIKCKREEERDRGRKRRTEGLREREKGIRNEIK